MRDIEKKCDGCEDILTDEDEMYSRPDGEMLCEACYLEDREDFRDYLTKD